MAEDRKFRVKMRIKDDREGVIQYKSAERAYDSPLAKAVRQERTKARIAKFNQTHPDYKPPNHGKRKK